MNKQKLFNFSALSVHNVNRNVVNNLKPFEPSCKFACIIVWFKKKHCNFRQIFVNKSRTYLEKNQSNVSRADTREQTERWTNRERDAWRSKWTFFVTDKTDPTDCDFPSINNNKTEIKETYYLPLRWIWTVLCYGNCFLIVKLYIHFNITHIAHGIIFKLNTVCKILGKYTTIFLVPRKNPTRELSLLRETHREIHERKHI